VTFGTETAFMQKEEKSEKPAKANPFGESAWTGASNDAQANLERGSSSRDERPGRLAARSQ
jgi:hypothetical protein